MSPARHLLALLVALSLTSASANAEEDKPPPRTISVTAEGEVDATPDLAVVSFAVETTAPLAATAVEENARKSAAVTAAVKKDLGPNDRVTTMGYSLDPFYEQHERGSPAAPRIAGYVARNEVQVQLHAVDAVGRLIDTATGAGSNRVSGLQFTLEDDSGELRQALLEAGQEARRQAEAIAQALGVTLKQVVSAKTSSGPILYPQQRFAMAAAEARVTTPVEPGEVSVRASLQVTYEIE